MCAITFQLFNQISKTQLFWNLPALGQHVLIFPLLKCKFFYKKKAFCENSIQFWTVFFVQI